MDVHIKLRIITIFLAINKDKAGKRKIERVSEVNYFKKFLKLQ